MIPIKKLPITLEQTAVAESEYLNKWQIAINAIDEQNTTLVQKSQQANVNTEELWEHKKITLVKKELRKHLLHEQKGVCCYCGDKIEKTNFTIEHLNPKSNFPALMFDYQNLFAVCAGGQPIKEHFTLDTAMTIEQIAAKYNVEIKKVTVSSLSNPRKDSLIEKNTKVKIRHGERADLHCDEYKENKKITIQPISNNQQICNFHDAKQNYEVWSCEDKISYLEDGRIAIDNDAEHPTLKTLNLNLKKLKEKRKAVFEQTEQFFFSLKEDIEDDEEINSFIQEQINTLENMEIAEAFYFVKTYFLRQKIAEVS